MRRGIIAAVVLVASLLAGCTVAPDGGASAVAADAHPLTVAVRDGVLVLDDTRTGDRSEVRLGDGEGEVLHAVLRPGEHDEDTVLALTRVREPGLEPRYELRYLVASDTGISELLWLPWRQQVDATAASLLDVPTLPVWSPDGSTVAWIEWAADGTRLRTIDWVDTGAAASPADDGEVYLLDEVPPGTQLEAWHDGDDGLPELVGRSADDRWSIRLDPTSRSDTEVVVQAAGFAA